MNKAFNRVIKSHILLAIMTFFAVALLSIGITYSIFQIDSKNTRNQVVEIGVLDAVGTSSTDPFVLNDLYPESANKITEENKKFNFTLNNNGTYDVKYTVYMNDITDSFLAANASNEEYAGYKKITTDYYKYINYKLDGDMDSLTNLKRSLADSKFIIMTGILKAGTQEEHFLQFFLDNKDTTTDGAPNDITGSLISLDIHFEAEAYDEKYAPGPAGEVLAKLGITANEITPDFTKVSPTISNYIDPEFSDTIHRIIPNCNTIIYSSEYSLDSTSGLYALVNPITIPLENALTELTPGDYFVYGQTESCKYLSATDRVTIQKFVGVDDGVILYQEKQAIAESGGNTGVYSMEDDYGISYYFRGAPENNYVKFANLYWRIIRINGDGSLRLAYDGTSLHGNGEKSSDRLYASKTKFNDNKNDNRFLGYMHGTSSSSLVEAQTNTESSNIKNLLDEMYTSKLSEYDKYISDTLFCHDRSVFSGLGYGTSETEYNGKERLEKTDATPDKQINPTLKCSNKNDAYTVNDTIHGNGALTYPIGLITADETSLAGAVYFASNEQFYLTRGNAFWLMTAFDYTSSLGARNFGVNIYGAMARSDVNNPNSYGGVVPVINIKQEYALKMKGEGTISSPYIVE